MAFITEDSVLETSTTTGTGSITVAGAVTGFRAFSAVCATNDIFPYIIEAVDANLERTGEWETGVGTYASANTLARTEVFESSNAGAAVDFAAGTKRVSIGALGRFAKPHLIATQATTSGATVSFTSIPQYYNALVFEMLGVSHSDGSSQTINMAVSGSNGSTYATAQQCSNTITAAQAVYGGITVPNYLASAGMWMAAGMNLTTAESQNSIASANIRNVAWRIDAAGIDAVQFSVTASAFDAGSINLWGLA